MKKTIQIWGGRNNNSSEKVRRIYLKGRPRREKGPRGRRLRLKDALGRGVGALSLWGKTGRKSFNFHEGFL